MVLEQKTLGLDDAQRVIAAVIEECKRVSHPAVAIYVVDKAGEIIGAARMDGRNPRFGKAAHRKAYTAAVFERDTLGLIEFWNRQESEGHRGPHDWNDPMLTTLPGGMVVRLNGNVVGGIGVAGGSSGGFDVDTSDEHLADYAVHSLGEGFAHGRGW